MMQYFYTFFKVFVKGLFDHIVLFRFQYKYICDKSFVLWYMFYSSNQILECTKQDSESLKQNSPSLGFWKKK